MKYKCLENLTLRIYGYNIVLVVFTVYRVVVKFQSGVFLHVKSKDCNLTLQLN